MLPAELNELYVTTGSEYVIKCLDLEQRQTDPRVCKVGPLFLCWFHFRWRNSSELINRFCSRWSERSQKSDHGERFLCLLLVEKSVKIYRRTGSSTRLRTERKPFITELNRWYEGGISAADPLKQLLSPQNTKASIHENTAETSSLLNLHLHTFYLI